MASEHKELSEKVGTIVICIILLFLSYATSKIYTRGHNCHAYCHMLGYKAISNLHLLNIDNRSAGIMMSKGYLET